MEEKTMGITRVPKLEVNLNTFIQIFTLASMIIGGVAIWIDKGRDVEDLQAWRTSHETIHKDHLAEVRANDVRMEERFRGVETDARKVASQVESLAYRVTVTEQASTSTASAIKELQSTLSETSGDLKVMREILQRLEAAQRRGPDSR